MSGAGDSEAHESGPRKKHRHDLGHEDHGAKLAAGTTRAIQGLLGLWIALTLAFVVYALVDGTRHKAEKAPASTTPSPSAPR